MSDASKSADSSVSSLVKKALLREHVERRFDIASNIASAELKDLGPGALPEIEAALMSELNVGDEAGARVREFPGLLDVLVAFFDVARKHDIQFAERLLQSLRPPLQVHALSAIWSIWLGRSKTGPIPENLLNAIQVLAGSGTEKTSAKANALLTAYSTLGTRRHHAPAEKF